MKKFNKFTYKVEIDFFQKLTRQVLVEKIPVHIKKALNFGWKKLHIMNFEYDKQCNFCGKITNGCLLPYVSEKSNKCLDICCKCDELMHGWNNE